MYNSKSHEILIINKVSDMNIGDIDIGDSVLVDHERCKSYVRVLEVRRGDNALVVKGFIGRDVQYVHKYALPFDCVVEVVKKVNPSL